MKKLINIIGCLGISAAALAQAPSWSINPNAYQYSMTITAVADVNCTELADTNTQIAAFVGNTLHGTASTTVNVNNRFQANLVIYSNNPSGEVITFKIYNAALDSIYNTVDTVIFQTDLVLGDPANPFPIRNNHQPSKLILDYNLVDENVPVASLVGKFDTEDQDAKQLFTYTFVSGSGDSNNTSFSINGNQLLINEIPDYEIRRQYGVRVKSTDDQGCGVTEHFLIHVQDKNDLPSLIVLSDTTVDENIALGTTIATISAVDEDSSAFDYSLVAGTGDIDNALFAISGDKLKNRDSINYESQSLFRIRVRVKENGGGSIEQMFVLTVNDLNEAPIMEDQVFYVSEKQNASFVIDSIIFSDVDGGQTHNLSYLNQEFTPVLIESQTGKLTLQSEVDFETRSEYSYQVFIEDSGTPTLIDTATITFIVVDEIEKDLPASDFISPNGDGKNDFWTIRNVELYSSYHLQIYSATGAVVFERNSNYNNDFDGTYNGENLPQGVYYYFLKNTNGNELFKGSINLIR